MYCYQVAFNYSSDGGVLFEILFAVCVLLNLVFIGIAW